MLFGIDFKIGELLILMNDIKKNVIILCENQNLVDYWKNILKNIKDTEDVYEVGLDFSEISNEDTDEKFYDLLKEIVVSEEDGCITIQYPDGEFQNFFISTDVNVVYNCDTYWDLWFCIDDSFHALCEYIKSEEWFNEGKDYLIKQIKRGRYGINV